MRKIVGLISLIIIFFASAAIGFFLPDWVAQAEDGGNTVVPELVNTPPDNLVFQEEIEEDILPEVLSITKPLYSNGMYTVDVTAQGKDITLFLADNEKNTISGSAVHETSNTYSLSPTTSGVYYVYAIDGEGRVSDYQVIDGCTVVAAIKKVTAAEFQSLMMAKDENNANKQLRGRINNAAISYHFSGIEENEPRPKSYTEIINRLKMKTWSGIQVTSVGYDSQGRLISANISVAY